MSAVGRWEVAKDKEAPSGAGVLSQLAKSEGDIFNSALVSDTRYLDVDISVNQRSVSGRIDQGGGGCRENGVSVPINEKHMS